MLVEHGRPQGRVVGGRRQVVQGKLGLAVAVVVSWTWLLGVRELDERFQSTFLIYLGSSLSVYVI